MIAAIKKGFTLIELMIVVAIVGVLAAIALPVYQDYIARSQVSEAVAGAGAVKTALSEFYASNGAFPTADIYGSAADAGRYTASLLHATTGIITGKMRPGTPVSNAVRSMEFTLEPTCVASGPAGGKAVGSWQCKVAAVTLQKYLPSGCQVVPGDIVGIGC